MKINHSSKSKKKLFILVGFIVFILAAGLLIYLYPMNGTLFGWSPKKKSIPGVNLHAPTDEQKQAGENTKDATINEAQKPNNTNETPTPPTPQPGAKDRVALSITAANQNPPYLQVRSEIGIVTNTGICTLTLTNGPKSIVKTAPVQALARLSTCQGFDVPLTELSSGQWDITLHFENEQLAAETTKKVTVQ